MRITTNEFDYVNRINPILEKYKLQKLKQNIQNLSICKDMKFYICKTTECLEFFLIVFEKNCIYRIDVKYTNRQFKNYTHTYTH